MQTTAEDRLPVRVVTDHEPLSDGTCGGCGQRWPCHTVRRQALAQLGTRERICTWMTIWQLRLMSHPDFGRVAAQVNERLYDWIDNAVAAQQRFDVERRRAAVAVSTGAQWAVRNIVGWTDRYRFRNQRPVMGQPRERVGSR